MGIFKLNGIDYMGGGGGGNTNYEELTQLEYDALTEEEKNNGTIYFITDTNSNQDGKFQPVIYSENEREIGVWTDGKPLYEKTVHFTTTSSTNTYISVPHNVSDADTIFIYDVFVQSSSMSFILSGYKGDAAANEIIGLLNNRDNTFDYKCGASAINSDAYVILRYTKTTDQPGSGQWTPQGVPAHHYSTEEQIVGTWVDGKTVYEQTIIGNAISDTGINVLWERTDIDTVVEYNCIFLDDNNLEYNANYYYSTGAYFRVFIDTQSVWTNTKGIVCQRSSNQAINGTRLTVLYTKSPSQGGN